MLNHRLLAVLGAGLLAVCLCRPTYAQTFTYSSGSHNYNVTSGGLAIVNVYLNETDPVGVTPTLSTGLFDYDVAVSTTTPGAITAVSPNLAQFDDPTAFALVNPSPITAGTTSVGLEVVAASGVATGTVIGNTSQILLGDFTVSGGAAAGSSTTFNISSYEANGPNTFTSDGTELDDLIQPGTFTVTTIASTPEPTTGAIATGFLSWALGRRARRKARLS